MKPFVITTSFNRPPPENCPNHCCNKQKGSDLASLDPPSGQTRPLFNPRKQRWAEHFSLAGNGLLISSTPEGRTTIRLLQLNQPERVEERKLLQESGFWNP
jgi:hypothetical protein